MLCSSVLVVAACSARPGTRTVDDQPQAPGLTLDHHIAEGTGDPEPVDLELDAGSDAPAPPPPRAAPPDPLPLSLAEQWEYTLRYANAEVSVERTRKLIYPKPVVTERRMGRFAIELWIGRELIDRVRFDFPLLGAEELPSGKRTPLHEPPSLLAGADVSLAVRVPASPRATRAVLVDRATGAERELPWPPDAPLPAVRVAAPPPAAASATDAGSPQTEKPAAPSKPGTDTPASKP